MGYYITFLSHLLIIPFIPFTLVKVEGILYSNGCCMQSGSAVAMSNLLCNWELSFNISHSSFFLPFRFFFVFLQESRWRHPITQQHLPLRQVILNHLIYLIHNNSNSNNNNLMSYDITAIITMIKQLIYIIHR